MTAELHCHSQFSLVDGLSRPAELVGRAASLGLMALALTDHGCMSGLVQAVAAARGKLKIIPGIEAYTQVPQRVASDVPYYHQTLLATSARGYRNLSLLQSIACSQFYHRVPRIPLEILLYEVCDRDDLVWLTGCRASYLNRLLLRRDEQTFFRVLRQVMQRFSGAVYIELMAVPEDLEEPSLPQAYLNALWVRVAQKTGLPCVLTADAHMAAPEDVPVHKTKMRIRGVEDGYFQYDHRYIPTDEERVRWFCELMRRYEAEGYRSGGLHWGRIAEEALAQTDQLAARVDEGWFSELAQAARGAVQTSLARRPHHEFIAELWGRLEELPLAPGSRKEYQERLKREIAVIDEARFWPYFQICADVRAFARERGIPVGPGRGSVGGSLVAYLAGISDVDPIRFNCIFERFLRPGKLVPPDIDMDFSAERRDEVLSYCIERYDALRVASYGTYRLRSLAQDLQRIGLCQLAQANMQALSKLEVVLSDLEEIDVERLLSLREYRAVFGDAEELARIIAGLLGRLRFYGQHAAGVAIALDVAEFAPQIVIRGQPVCGYDLADLTELGILKLDLLGLATLDVVADAWRLVWESEGESRPPYEVMLEDKAVYQQIRENARGLFQLDSSLAARLIQMIAPANFEELVALNSLCRPGPLLAGIADRYAAAKRIGSASVSRFKETYGLIIYQEQVMQQAIELGWSLEQAEALIKAVAKKREDKIESLKPDFVAAATRAGLSEEQARSLFSQMRLYSFNRAHAVAYSLLTVETAYLRAHYPAAFFAALLSHESDKEKRDEYEREAIRSDIVVVPAYVGGAVSRYEVRRDHDGDLWIVQPLTVIDGIGEKAAEEISQGRVAPSVRERLASAGALLPEDMSYEQFVERAARYCRKLLGR